MGEATTIVAIAGGIMSTGITGLVTWKVSKNSSSVELAKVNAENQRLRQGHQEEERRNRQSTYRQFIEAAWEFHQLMGFAAARTDVVEAGEKYRRLTAGVLLFGPPSVRDGAYQLTAVYQQIWESLAQERKEHPSKPEEKRWQDASSPLKKEFGQRTSEVIHLMHADVTRGITGDSD